MQQPSNIQAKSVFDYAVPQELSRRVAAAPMRIPNVCEYHLNPISVDAASDEELVDRIKCILEHANIPYTFDKAFGEFTIKKRDGTDQDGNQDFAKIHIHKNIGKYAREGEKTYLLEKADFTRDRIFYDEWWHVVVSLAMEPGKYTEFRPRGYLLGSAYDDEDDEDDESDYVHDEAFAEAYAMKELEDDDEEETKEEETKEEETKEEETKEEETKEEETNTQKVLKNIITTVWVGVIVYILFA
jgi:F0F1-type ATP synthase assembly protein I